MIRRHRSKSVHRGGVVTMAIAVFVATLVFGVLALLESRDLLSAIISWP